MSQLFACLSASLSSFSSCSYSLSVCLSYSFALIKHIEEKVDEGKGRCGFFSPSPHDCICVRRTVHRRCAATSRLSPVGSHRWVIAVSFSLAASLTYRSVWLSVCLPTLTPPCSLKSRVWSLFSSAVIFVLDMRVRSRTFTVDDRRGMGGVEASHAHIDWPSSSANVRWNWREKTHSFGACRELERSCLYLASRSIQGREDEEVATQAG